jgi:hypothetical protein
MVALCFRERTAPDDCGIIPGIGENIAMKGTNKEVGETANAEGTVSAVETADA